MDPLTHSATGVFLSRAGFKRMVPQATWILLLASNAPDVDVVTAAGGSLNYLHYHRHLTHSLLAAPLLAVLPVLLVRLFSRQPMRWLPAYVMSLVAVASHLLLDLTNVYGIRLLLPFSSRWLRLDQTSVIDLWIWAVALVALAGPLLARLVNAEIGASGVSATHGRGFAIFAIAFMLCLNGARAILHGRAVAILESRVYSGAAPLHVAAFPSMANPMFWTGLVETRDGYSLHTINLSEDFDPTRGAVYYKPDPSPAITVAERTPVFQQYLQFALFPLWRVLPAANIENGMRVEVMDLRFGTPGRPGFLATAVLDANLRVVESSFQFGRVRPR